MTPPAKPRKPAYRDNNTFLIFVIIFVITYFIFWWNGFTWKSFLMTKGKNYHMVLWINRFFTQIRRANEVMIISERKWRSRTVFLLRARAFDHSRLRKRFVKRLGYTRYLEWLCRLQNRLKKLMRLIMFLSKTRTIKNAQAGRLKEVECSQSDSAKESMLGWERDSLMHLLTRWDEMTEKIVILLVICLYFISHGYFLYLRSKVVSSSCVSENRDNRVTS